MFKNHMEIKMGKFYKNSIIPEKLRRNFDVYERINQLGINLGKYEENVSNITKAGLPIASIVFHESGLVYLSGQGGGENQMNDDPERVKQGQEAAQKIADNMLTRLHWALKCGNEGGDLNDVLYTVKALGMVVSTDVDFDSGPAVMNGFSLRWQSIFGGLGEFFKNGKDDGGYSGIHARSAIGGFTGRFSIEPEIIVAIPPELSIAIIKNRGWLFPVDPRIQSQLKK